MNEIVNKLVLAGDKFMPEIHLRQPEFTFCACGPFTKTKEEYKKSKKQQIRNTFIKTNKIKLIFNMTGLMEILKI